MTRHRLTIVLVAMIVLASAGYGVMFTILDDLRDAYGISESGLGGVVAIGFFASFASQVVLAPRADRGHAKSLLVNGLLLQTVSLVTMAFAHSLPLLLLARAVMGIGAGMMSPAARRIVVLADPEHMGRNIGRMLSADVVGFAIGPAVSAVLVEPFGIAAPFLLIAALTVPLVPIALRTHVEESEPTAATSARFAFDLLRHRAYFATVLFGATVFIMIGTFDVLWVLVLDDLGAADWMSNLGIILFAVPLVAFGPLGGRWAQQFGPFRLATIGLVVGAFSIVGYGYWPSAGVMFLFAMVHAVNDGLTVTSSGVAVAMVAPPERQAGAQGLLGGVQTLVGGITSLAAGAVYESQGRATVYTATGIVMLVVIVAAVGLLGHEWSGRPATVGASTAAPLASSH